MRTTDSTKIPDFTSPDFTYVYRHDPSFRRKLITNSKDVGYSTANKSIVHRIYRELREAGYDVGSARYVVTMLLGMGKACGEQERHQMFMAAFAASRNIGAK